MTADFAQRLQDEIQYQERRAAQTVGRATFVTPTILTLLREAAAHITHIKELEAERDRYLNALGDANEQADKEQDRLNGVVRSLDRAIAENNTFWEKALEQQQARLAAAERVIQVLREEEELARILVSERTRVALREFDSQNLNKGQQE